MRTKKIVKRKNTTLNGTVTNATIEDKRDINKEEYNENSGWVKKRRLIMKPK